MKISALWGMATHFVQSITWLRKHFTAMWNFSHLFAWSYLKLWETTYQCFASAKIEVCVVQYNMYILLNMRINQYSIVHFSCGSGKMIICLGCIYLLSHKQEKVNPTRVDPLVRKKTYTYSSEIQDTSSPRGSGDLI